MAELTTEQRLFLLRYKLSPSLVFDATGMTRAQYQDAMKETGKLFAIGVTPCKKDGHSLRERNGHCIQCSTKDIAFLMRHFKNAFVYISASRTRSLIKIGFSTDPDSRERTLNSFSYGGASDWMVVGKVRVESAGRAEFDVHAKLSHFNLPQTYLHQGLSTKCLEVFSCSYPTARAAVASSISDLELKRLWERPDAYLNYNFEDVSR